MLRKGPGQLTFQSLIIEAHASRESAIEPYVTGGDHTIVLRLNAYTWPASSEVFAKERGLALDYVDNSWSRVALSGADLSEFLKLGATSDPDAADLLKRMGNHPWYVINEEEF